MDIKIVDEKGVEKTEAPTEFKSENNISAPVLPEMQEKAIFQVMVRNLSSTGLVKWLYVLQSTSTNLRRIMLF